MKLSKKITFEGKDIEEISFDFEALTGADLLAAFREAALIGHDQNSVQALNGECQTCVAAKAAKVPVDLLLALPAKDLSAILVLAMRFLVGLG